MFGFLFNIENKLISSRLKEGYIHSNYNDIYNEIINYNAKFNEYDLTWLMKFNIYYNRLIESDFLCSVCGSMCNFRGFKRGFNKFCSSKCSSNSDGFQDRRMNTTKVNLSKKYGEDIENVFQLEYVKDKIKNSCIEKYGASNPNKNKDVRRKLETTNLNKYGYVCCLSSKEVRKKVEATNLIKYGFKTATKNEDIKKKIKASCIEKYGGMGASSDIIRNKMEITNLDRYGSINIFSSLKYKNMVKNGLVKNIINDSKKEVELKEFISSLNIDFISNDRLLLDGMELDIYIPTLKIAIEFNGLYWHSEKYKDKDYHLNKTNRCKDNGINLYHVWEDDWDNNKEVIKSNIRKVLNKTHKIKTTNIKNVDSIDYCLFLNLNSIDYDNIKGLYYDDELVSIMCIKEDNIIKYHEKVNVDVINGFDILYKSFKKSLYFYDDNSFPILKNYPIFSIEFPIIRKCNRFVVYDCGRNVYFLT